MSQMVQVRTRTRHFIGETFACPGGTYQVRDDGLLLRVGQIRIPNGGTRWSAGRNEPGVLPKDAAYLRAQPGGSKHWEVQDGVTLPAPDVEPKPLKAAATASQLAELASLRAHLDGRAAALDERTTALDEREDAMDRREARIEEGIRAATAGVPEAEATIDLDGDLTVSPGEIDDPEAAEAAKASGNLVEIDDAPPPPPPAPRANAKPDFSVLKSSVEALRASLDSGVHDTYIAALTAQERSGKNRSTALDALDDRRKVVAKAARAG